MPLYSSTGENIGGHKAIVYNCRTSNEWENDMALAVTHFPSQKLTFAMLFGASEEQERSVLTRLRKAGADTAHPMLLPGILAELERIRQMDAVDEMINDLEEQIYQIDNQTVATWNLSQQTKAERNKQKRKAWLDATFLRNLLAANTALLLKMRRHLDEFPILVGHSSTAKCCQHVCRQQPTLVDDLAYTGTRPGTPQSLVRIANLWPLPDPPIHGSESLMGWNTTHVGSDPESSEIEAKYEDLLHQAASRMKDRLVAIISEYDDKIRACTMEVDGMAMATQWSQGETNMEIATATGEDSSQMRSIALVTMVFLPGTFFASNTQPPCQSMFSMTFFDWNPDPDSNHPVVSGNIWIYFLATTVFTLITLLLFWYFILSRQRRRRLPQDSSGPE
ncbi:hypothetical protein N656DRAFT_770350 [Canariomyces notabilis]|uniref:Uncharacterized protein n=1 Tax=Canariomyces notabilis TaxID=2074819 RepID=A0AAN6QIL4_9PEZI|nr:hypothetical protein N656DRAFT_770350 [Canariomyces arenarius]